MVSQGSKKPNSRAEVNLKYIKLVLSEFIGSLSKVNNDHQVFILHLSKGLHVYEARKDM